MTSVSFVGLGKLGLPLATNLGKNGVKVLAIDKNSETITSLQRNQAPFWENGLQENIDLSAPNMTYTTSYDGVETTDVSIILVNTPSKKLDGSFSNEYIIDSLTALCKNLKHKKTYHLFVISSTVMPESCSKEFVPLIESITRWTLNEQFGLCYIPDFVAIGTVIRDFENPDFLLIGESNSKAGNIAEALYLKEIEKPDTPIKKINLIEAEIAKISLNAYICTKISFANFLSNLCEGIDGTNVDNITSTIGLDKRIGTRYFKGGLPFGGTCFPRDTWAFMKFADKKGLKASHIHAAQEINDVQFKRLLDLIKQLEPDSLSIIGLAFKPGTGVVTQSVSTVIIPELLKNNIKHIHVFDAKQEALDNTKLLFGDQLIYHSSAQTCVRATSCCLIVTPGPELDHIDEWLDDNHIMIDCWRAVSVTSGKKINIGQKIPDFRDWL